MSHRPSPSPLGGLWAQTARSGSESAWARLPDRALQQLCNGGNGGNGGAVSPEDLAFLADATTRSPAGAIAAIRVLGCIGEEGLAPGCDVGALLLSPLLSGSAAVRYAAVEALWQIGDCDSLPSLRAALDREPVNEVRQTIEHVIRILDRRGP